jgi:hypothetical protein
MRALEKHTYKLRKLLKTQQVSFDTVLKHVQATQSRARTATVFLAESYSESGKKARPQQVSFDTVLGLF